MSVDHDEWKARFLSGSEMGHGVVLNAQYKGPKGCQTSEN